MVYYSIVRYGTVEYHTVENGTVMYGAIWRTAPYRIVNFYVSFLKRKKNIIKGLPHGFVLLFLLFLYERTEVLRLTRDSLVQTYTFHTGIQFQKLLKIFYFLRQKITSQWSTATCHKDVYVVCLNRIHSGNNFDLKHWKAFVYPIRASLNKKRKCSGSGSFCASRIRNCHYLYRSGPGSWSRCFHQ